MAPKELSMFVPIFSGKLLGKRERAGGGSVH